MTDTPAARPVRAATPPPHRAAGRLARRANTARKRAGEPGAPRAAGLRTRRSKRASGKRIPRPDKPAGPHGRAARALWSVAALVLAALAALALGCDNEAPAPAPLPPGPGAVERLPTAEIGVGDVPLVVEVADQAAERNRGMMFRRRLGPDEAMLFVYPYETNHSPFWMKNTLVDLDIAFIAADGTILQIERMRALSTESTWSREPYRYALETPAGWFASHGIGEGATVTLPEDLRRPGVGDPPDMGSAQRWGTGARTLCRERGTGPGCCVVGASAAWHGLCLWSMRCAAGEVPPRPQDEVGPCSRRPGP